MTHRSQQGFTLLELVVATAIFAIMSAMVYTTLAGVRTNLQFSQQAESSMRELHYAMRRIALDVTQLQPRPVRDELGDVSGAIQTGGGQAAIELSVGGWRNPLQAPRGSIQRVAYIVDGDILARLHWPVLDRTLGTEPLRVDLLTGVINIEVRFLDQTGEWSEQWPPANSGATPGARLRPRAVEIVIEHDEWGVINRIVEIAG